MHMARSSRMPCGNPELLTCVSNRLISILLHLRVASSPAEMLPQPSQQWWRDLWHEVLGTNDSNPPLVETFPSAYPLTMAGFPLEHAGIVGTAKEAAGCRLVARRWAEPERFLRTGECQTG